MDEKDKYSADEAAHLLQSQGYSDITKRTVNYYAFDKNMFQINEPGKKCFSDIEINKIIGIRLLKEHTNLTLAQIKEIINKHSLNEVREICFNRSLSVSPYYHNQNSMYVSDRSGSSFCSSSNINSSVAINSGIPGPGTEKNISPRTIKVNNDITLIISNNINNDKLSKLVEFIKGL